MFTLKPFHGTKVYFDVIIILSYHIISYDIIISNIVIYYLIL